MKVYKSTFVYVSSLIIFLLYLFFRSPEIFLEGRYFAEEGSVWWSFSIANSFIDTLLFSPAAGGYVCLICNLQIAATKLLPIEIGPIFTAISSIFIFLSPSMFFFKLSKDLLNHKKRIFISILLLIVPSMNFLEVFANSISSPQYLAITTFIILLYGLNRNELLGLQYLVIFIAFLSYYYSLFLLPCFILKYYFTRNKLLKIPIILGIFSSLVQLNVLIYLISKQSLFYRNFNEPFNPLRLLNNLGYSFSINFLSEKFYKSQNLNYIILIFVVCLLFFSLRQKFDINILITITAVFLQLALIHFGQIGESYYGRYAVVASTLTLFIVFQTLKSDSATTLFFAFFFITSIYNFNVQGGSYFIECNEYCISWEKQLSDVSSNVADKYVHWPMGEGEPYWYTNTINPKPNPSPYQKTVLGSDFLILYDLSYFDILKNNIEYFKNIK